AGGGRYDGLVEALGGPATPAIGFAVGFDRLVEILSLTQQVQTPKPRLFIAALGQSAQEQAFHWSADLAREGVFVEMEHGQKSLKAQMKRANRLGAGYVLIVGEAELAQGRAVLRNMASKAQQEVPLNELIDELKTIIIS
ncbi:MAG: histidine--tRNA ligase, partial [Desulfatitalea sp.]|nr:histidine--tRNA ligase [Desulfatitalea sp.]